MTRRPISPWPCALLLATSLHVHALVHAREPGATVPAALGHVDGLTLAPGAVLRVPQQR